jgi:hypothetical protein
MKKITTILLILLLANCVPYWYKPMGYRLFSKKPKDGSPGYRLGWEHGCHSGLSTQFGGSFYISFYYWKRDVDITSSNPDFIKIRKRYKKELRDVNWDNKKEVTKNFSDYNTIFWTAHNFCRQMVHGTMQASDMTPALAGEERFTPGKHHLGSIWRINGRGDTRIGSGSNSLW